MSRRQWRYNLDLSEEMHTWLDEAAARRNVSKAEVIRTMLGMGITLDKLTANRRADIVIHEEGRPDRLVLFI